MKRRLTVGIWLLLIGPVLLILVGCGAGTADEDAPPVPTAGNVEDITITPTPFSFPADAEAEPVVETATEEAPGAQVTEAPAAPEAPVAPVEEAGITYTVQDGDTLLGVAMAHDVPMAAIQLQNDLGTSTVVKVGQMLEIPSAEGWQGASPFWVLYEVSEGETLSEIGKAYDVEVAHLTSVNGLSAADAIRAGELLILPVDGPAVARLPEPTATPIRLPTPTATPVPVVEAVEEPTATTEVATPVPAAPPPADVAAWPRELVRLINEFRAQHDLPPYIYNETLAQAAQAHANDCLQRGWCSHTGSDGSSVKERIVRAGYVGTGYAECWAQRQSPQGALDIWLDEIYPQADGTVEFGPHRRMMLHTWFTEIGVGIAETDWGYYFIADFGRP